ncbi:MAG: FG-GAP repeat protein [Planctomycetota bacterium]|nr:FG-GAP repeat protein [Planctomycetota bacterium]
MNIQMNAKTGFVIGRIGGRMGGAVALAIAAALQLAAVRPASAQCEMEPLHKFFASDGAVDDLFGFSVAVDGDVAIVGAVSDDDPEPGNPGCNAGAAYIFRFDGQGWVQEAKLVASDAACGDQYGVSVGISGDVAVVGAHWDLHAPGDGSSDGEGAAYVYRFDGAQWIEDAKLTAFDAAPGDAYGNAVAIEGDVIVIGADHRYSNQLGRAYVYRHDGADWIDDGVLTPWEGAGDGCFGYQGLDINGDVIIVGDWNQTDAWARGRAYIFRHDGAAWQEEAVLTASDAEYNDRFGIDVSVAGDMVVVGAYFEDEAGDNCGAAYLFEFDGGEWQELAKLLPSDGATWDWFGSSVAINDEIALIGSWWDDDLGTSSGSAYVYQRDFGGPDAWGEAGKLVAPDGAGSDEFSHALWLDGDRALIGSIKAAGAGDNTGAVYEYRGFADCNGNGVLDICDIADGTSEDANGNGIPDECECPADFDGDGDVDTADLLFLLGAWGTGGGDVDFDGDTDTADLLALLAAWGECPE